METRSVLAKHLECYVRIGCHSIHFSQPFSKPCALGGYEGSNWHAAWLRVRVWGVCVCALSLLSICCKAGLVVSKAD